MAIFPRIVIYQKKVDAIKRFHPWIFSGAIKQRDQDLTEGDIAEVYSETGEYLATGYYASGSIAVKILSFEKILDLRQFFFERLKSAYALRQTIGLANSFATNCYRLINSEGDGLPGLIIDWYNGTAVLQAHSVGIHQHCNYLIEGLQNIYGEALQAIYDKSAATLAKKSQIQSKNSYLFGLPQTNQVLESDHSFLVNWEEGQKTGFFLDQRENRRLFASYAKDKKVLNTFCYSGGFSVYAIAANAQLVHSVDSSAKAIEWTNQNVELNNPSQISHAAYTEDIFNFLKHCDDDYDLIVLDPPAFAKSLSARHQAAQAYKRLNLQALAKLKKGGVLFTFSCSQVVSVDQFSGAVTSAAIETGKTTQLLHHLTQPADHPTSIYHPEGSYLKGLVLLVN